jgi:hypothetical protein
MRLVFAGHGDRGDCVVEEISITCTKSPRRTHMAEGKVHVEIVYCVV